MGDPLSIIGGFAAILQISATVVSYIKSVKGAAADRQRLLVGINATTALCQTLSDTAEIDIDPWMNTLNTLCQLDQGPVAQFTRNLTYLRQKLEPGKKTKYHLDEWFQSLKWPFDSEKVNEILEDIERQKSLFTLALTNDSLRLSRAILNETWHISNKIDDVRSGQKLQLQKIQEISTGIGSIRIHQAEEVGVPESQDTTFVLFSELQNM